MREKGGSLRAPKPKLKGDNPREVRHPAPDPSALRVAETRVQHMERMRAMYMAGPPPPSAALAGPPAGAVPFGADPSVDVSPPRAAACAPISEFRQRSPSAPPRVAGAGMINDLGDDWEDDVDDLLDWTSGLPAELE